jgi:RimJ/RimL family protein N-acetyltransferase
MASLTNLRQQNTLSPKSPAHTLENLLSYAELALHLNFQKEAGWALYYAQRAPAPHEKIPDKLADAALYCHPLWHQPARGKQVILQRPAPRHRAFVLDALNNDHFVQKYNAFIGEAESATVGYIQRSKTPSTHLRQLDWIVETTEGKPIGIASIADLNFAHQRGELLIGFPEQPRNRRLVIEATLLVLHVAFEHLRLEKLSSYVYTNNANAQKATTKLGFVQEGLLRDHIRLPGTNQRISLYVNGLLRTDFSQNPSLLALYRRLIPECLTQDIYQLDLDFFVGCARC